jgi:hypothetical protein
MVDFELKIFDSTYDIGFERRKNLSPNTDGHFTVTVL